MTIEKATSLLEEVLMTLARNSVHNKRLTEYADDLERYIAHLQKQNNETTVDEILDNEPEAN